MIVCLMLMCLTIKSVMYVILTILFVNMYLKYYPCVVSICYYMLINLISK